MPSLDVTPTPLRPRYGRDSLRPAAQLLPVRGPKSHPTRPGPAAERLACSNVKGKTAAALQSKLQPIRLAKQDSGQRYYRRQQLPPLTSADATPDFR